jgi:hypothetical protein
MRTLLSLAVATLLPFGAFAQASKPVQRKDSVTVSAGISKEQLALEDQLNDMCRRVTSFYETAMERMR